MYLIGFAVVASLGCEKKQTAEERKADSLAHCIADGIPSRAAAIQNASYVAEGKGDTKGMIWINGGKFLMGADEFPDSRPMHEISVNGFYIDEHEVTNAEYAEFVKATNYKNRCRTAIEPGRLSGCSG
jgi:sulfatase modifying factor 1